MIQDIAPHRLDLGYKQGKPGDDDYVFVLGGNRVMVVDREGEDFLPRYAAVKPLLPESDNHLLYLFSFDDQAYYFYNAALADAPGFRFQDPQTFRGYKPTWMAFAGITASHLALWYAKNRFCGVCGSAMARKEDERAVHCPSCREVVYPRISPAVIVAVVDGDRLLLTRYANRPNARWSLVAGFTEVGETLEDTVRREVMEEVGVRVKNIRYYKSQPWAFSGSVLVGFFADLDGSAEVTLDTLELQEASWTDRRVIAEGDTSISLTSEMIEKFRQNAFPRG